MKVGIETSSSNANLNSALMLLGILSKEHKLPSVNILYDYVSICLRGFRNQIKLVKENSC